jgi:hypothetical protein
MISGKKQSAAILIMEIGHVKNYDLLDISIQKRLL